MKKITLLLILMTIPNWVVAENSNYTHTHTNTPIELESVSSNIGKQYAAVCFLGSGDCGAVSFGKGDEDMGIDTGNQCKNEGFDKTCQTGWHPEIGTVCPHDPSYIKCCKETCPANAATSCTGEVVGDDTCGYTCKKCCSTSCDSRYNYTVSQLTGSTGNGWVKDGEDFCDHCTRGKLYKRKAAPVPSGYLRCNCGGTNQFNSGGTYYYSSCNCCSNCSGYNLTNQTGCSYGYASCKDNCSGQTRYRCKSCNDSCSGYRDISSAISNCSRGYDSGSTQCGNVCYTCRSCSGYNYYWNDDGAHTIPYNAVCWHGYGGNSVITQRTPRTYESVTIRFHRGATVDFPLEVNGDLTLGHFICGSYGGQTAHGKIYFNYPITVNGTLVIERGATIEFRGGISGNYNTKCYDCDWREVSC